MRFMMLVKATKDCEAGVLPDEKILSEMGKYNEELVKAGALLAVDALQAELQGRARPVFQRKVHGHRRALRRDEGTDRRLLADPGEIEGGSHRMGQARPLPGRRGRGSPAVRTDGLSGRPRREARRLAGERGAVPRRGPARPEAWNDPVHGHPQGRQGHGGGRPPGRKVPVRHGGVL